MLGQQQYRTALFWQIGLAAYMQLISWVPLGRWNYQPCCPPGLEALRRGILTTGDVVGAGAFLLPVAIFWLGVRREWRWAIWVAVLATTVWLGLQLWTWWPPYLFGASDRWSQVYARAFAESTPILPRWANHLPPDAAHFSLQVLLAGTVVTGGLALVQRNSRSDADLFTLLDRFADAWNRHDLDALMAMMTDDCVFEASAGAQVDGQRSEGKQAVRAAFAAVFAAFHDAHWASARHFIAGNRGVSEWTFTGTQNDGKRVEVTGCDLFTFRGGKIAVKNSYRKNRPAI